MIIADTIDINNNNNFIDHNKIIPIRNNNKIKTKQSNNLLTKEILSLSLFIYREPSLSLSDIEIVVKQLGYLPYNIRRIGYYNEYNPTYPMVIVLYPLNSNNLLGRYQYHLGRRPFPTIYWMSCPILYARISQLEKDGWVQTFQTILEFGIINKNDQPISEENNRYLQIMKECHRLYALERYSSLSNEDKKLIEENGWDKSLYKVGIAGIRNYKAVKCLHAHYSHYLAMPSHNNIIGKWVHQLLNNQTLSFHDVHL